MLYILQRYILFYSCPNCVHTCLYFFVLIGIHSKTELGLRELPTQSGSVQVSTTLGEMVYQDCTSLWFPVGCSPMQRFQISMIKFRLRGGTRLLGLGECHGQSSSKNKRRIKEIWASELPPSFYPYTKRIVCWSVSNVRV